MKIKAKIEWVIDDNALNIVAGTTEVVNVDADYVEADESDIVSWIENELSEKYGTTIRVSQNFRSETDCGDFVIKNMDELIEDLKFDEFEDKTDPGYVG